MKEFPIGETGIWHCSDVEPHSFDASLCDGLIEFFREVQPSSILDVGCGDGRYVEALLKAGFKDVYGVDGNPNTAKFSPHCRTLDITKENLGFVADWAICLEVGEHIPKELEDAFLKNLTSSFIDGVVLSWFPAPGHGMGHINERDNNYVKSRMGEFHLVSDEEAQARLRKASSLYWFGQSLMVFRQV